MDEEYKYDIAFSFCQEDENIVNEINNSLGENFSVFIYSNKQKELVGTDGEIEFKKVFSKLSRVVVVLYRDIYGTTTWTRIEEEAIRSRAYDEGYDFTLFIPLDKNKKTPQYLPKTRIWYNLERFGIDGAANIISYLVSERGGDIKPLSSKEKAEKLNQKLDFKNKLQNFREYGEGANTALIEVENLFKIIDDKVKEITLGPSFDVKIEHRKYAKVFYKDLFLQFYWSYQWTNNLDKSNLEVSIQKLIYSKNHFDPPRLYTIKKFDYDFEKNFNWDNIWRLKHTRDKNYYKSDTLAEKHLSDFLTTIENEEIK